MAEIEYTPNLALAKQPTGAREWGAVLNENFDKIDEVFGDFEALPSQQGNAGKFLTTDGTNPSWADVGSGLEIGDIGFAAFGIDETKNKRRYLNGQVISQSQFVSFTNKIKASIQLYPNLATSETNWQAEVTNSKLGQCGKFVIDDNAGTIRLPKVVNINGLQDLSLLGGIKAESLPNITGEFDQQYSGRTNVNATGALYLLSSSYRGSQGNDGTSQAAIGLDASLSSSTYQDNAPVQQEAIQYPYFIQVATGTEESVDVTREIELNNPFSLLDYKWSEYEITNASWLISNGAFQSGATYISVYNLLLEIYNGTVTKDGVSVKMSTEAYEDTDFVLNTADTTFRLPIKVKLTENAKLYFYVGETIQDANVINASGVLIRVADLSDSYISGLGMPSSRYINLTLGASGTQYTAPANGWFYLKKQANGNNQNLSLQAGTMQVDSYAPSSGSYCGLYIPVKKDTSCSVIYSLGGGTVAFRFIYAGGE